MMACEKWWERATSNKMWYHLMTFWNLMYVNSRLNRIDPSKNIIFRPMQNGNIDPNLKYYLENYFEIS